MSKLFEYPAVLGFAGVTITPMMTAGNLTLLLQLLLAASAILGEWLKYKQRKNITK